MVGRDHETRCERKQRSRVRPCSLILYSNVPLPVERLSNKPNVHNLFAARGGKKLSLPQLRSARASRDWQIRTRTEPAA